jgi:hypothetical protein
MCLTSGCMYKSAFKFHMQILLYWLFHLGVEFCKVELHMYTLSNKNQAALKFIKTVFLITSATVAIIICIVCSSAMFVHSWSFCVFHLLQSFVLDVY